MVRIQAVHNVRMVRGILRLVSALPVSGCALQRIIDSQDRVMKSSPQDTLEDL